MTAIVEQIALDLVGYLEGIATEYGYPIDIVRVHRPRKLGDEGYVTEDRVITLIQRSRQRAKPDATENASSNAEWIVSFEAIGVRKLGDSVTTAQDSVMNEISACIEQALMTNPQHTSSDVDGNVIDTLIQSSEPLDPTDGAYCGSRVAFDVHYRHPYTAPFVSA